MVAVEPSAASMLTGEPTTSNRRAKGNPNVTPRLFGSIVVEKLVSAWTVLVKFCAI